MTFCKNHIIICCEVKKLEAHQIFQNEFRPVTNFRNKQMKINIDAMNKEINAKCSENYSICDQKKFNEEFQILTNIVNVEDVNNKINEWNEDKNINRFSNIVENFKKENLRKLENKRKKHVLEKFKRIILIAANHFKKLNMTLAEFYNIEDFSKYAYKGEKSELFIQAVRMNEMNKITKLVANNKFIIFEFDHVNYFFI